MNTLLSQVSTTERKAIDYMIKSFVDYDQPHAPVETLLEPWEKAKQSLFRLLGDKLIIHKQINIELTEEEIENQLCQNTITNEFISNLRLACHNVWSPLYFNNDIAWDLIEIIFSLNSFAKGQVPRDFYYSIDGVEYKLNAGMKIIKALTHFLKSLGDTTWTNWKDSVEEFRIEMSKITNVKTTTGDVVLSIHPLDYMTMSMNGCNWRSCMSWENGEFRIGTVEMMNSPMVVEAYVASSDKWCIPDSDYEWSNKKWRELFIVCDECIASIKGYPYCHNLLEEEIIKWIADLAKENLGVTYITDHLIRKQWSSDICSQLGLSFETNMMYNDFGCRPMGSPHTIALNANYIKEADPHYIVYSGVTECTICGRVEDLSSEYNPEAVFTNEGDLHCHICAGLHRCDNCNRWVYDLYATPDNEHLCEHCYNNFFEPNAFSNTPPIDTRKPYNIGAIYKPGQSFPYSRLWNFTDNEIKYEPTENSEYPYINKETGVRFKEVNSSQNPFQYLSYSSNIRYFWIDPATISVELATSIDWRLRHNCLVF